MERKHDHRPASSPPEPARPRQPEEADGRYGAWLDLQRRAGNAAVSSALGRGRAPERGGAPVPASAGAARSVLGDLADDVRVHQAGEGGPEVPAGALAATEGTDIAVAPGAPVADSPAGALLLAHESAHVVQQTAPTGGSTEAAEDQADVAAVAAMAGRQVPTLGGARGVQYFEAPKHQASLTNAMDQVGFSDQEQQMAYLGNWCRDMSQAMVPMLNSTIGVQATMTLVSSVAQMKFGRPVTPAQLGMYDPVEHIDNPTGLVNADLLQNRLGGVDPGGALRSGAPTSIPVAGRGAFTTPERDVGPDAIAALMQTDAAGVPAYITQSRDYVKAEIRQAIGQKRTAEGLFHVGNFSHVVEDLFAHSNWIEVAVGDLIRSGGFTLEPGSEAAQDVQQRVNLGQPPIETYAGNVAARGRESRPVLMTGSFAPGAKGHDTLISLKAEVQNVLAGVEPFAPDGSTGKWWDFGLELLQNVEAAADAGNLGVIFSDHVRQVIDNMGLGQKIKHFTGGLEHKARSTFGEGFLGDVAAGAAGLLHGAASATVDATGEAWDTVVLGALKEGADLLGARMDLVKVAYYVKHGGEEIEQAWGVVKEAVTKLPAEIREKLLPALTKAEEAFRKKLRELLTAAYKRGVLTLMDALEGPIGATDVAESPVYRKVADLKAQLGPDGALRTALVEAVRNAAPGPAGSAMAARLQGASPEELVALASSPELKTFLSSLADYDRPVVLAALDPVNEAGERISQFDRLPDWAKAGGSHSQMAKDHADSPFFGAAFLMANEADRKIMGLLAQAWRELGSTGPAPGLEGTLPNEEEEEGEHLDPLVDTEAMDRERGRSFHETRDMADRVRRTGHADELPSALIDDLIKQLGDLAEAARKDAVRFPGGRALSRKIEDLITVLQGTPSARLAESACLALKSWIDQHLDETLSAGQRLVAGEVARLVDAAAHQIAQLGEPETDAEHAAHDSGQRSDAHYNEQLAMLAQQRDTIRLPAGRGARAATAADRAVAAARTTPEKLEAEVDRIINHPYETTWWRSTLATWLTAHKREVSQWILDRNRGHTHSH